jgi:hypothetical protein
MASEYLLAKQRYRVLLISLFIVAVIFMQAAATFRLFCPPERFTQLSSWRVLCEPLGWPFINYPMYHAAHYEGESINYYQVYAELEDGTEIAVYPEDLELNWWLFHRGIVASLLVEDEDGILFYAHMYEELHQTSIVAWRLENQPTVLKRGQTVQEAPQTVRHVSLGLLRSN